jgi:hypothetical protein
MTKEIEHCPECGKPMCFQRDTEDMPHEYDVCNDCGKHICIECSKIIDETEYCPQCYKIAIHEEHKKGGYFQRGCDECAKFLGHAVMKGDIQWK